MDIYWGKEPLCCPIVSWEIWFPGPPPLYWFSELAKSDIVQDPEVKNGRAKQLPLFIECSCWLEVMRDSLKSPLLETQPVRDKFSSVQFSLSVVSDSLLPHESQHARPPCPSPTPGVHSDSRPLSQWCHPAISSSVIPFSSCPQSSQHQSLFQWVNSSHEVAKVLEFQL